MSIIFRLARTQEESRIVEQVLSGLFPLESQFVGQTVLMQIANGSTFSRMTGGNNIDLSTTINTLASAAVLIHYAVQLANWIRQNHASSLPEPAAVLDTQALRAQLLLRMADYDNLKQILQDDPEKAERIVSLIVKHFER